MTKPNQPPRFNILIDTCVWLDIAKDYQQQAILAALEELIRQEDIALIIPRTIIAEFASNKARVIEESSRSLSSTLKRVKEAVERFGDPKKKAQCCAMKASYNERGRRKSCRAKRSMQDTIPPTMRCDSLTRSPGRPTPRYVYAAQQWCRVSLG
jgi:hypothetical protein